MTPRLLLSVITAALCCAPVWGQGQGYFPAARNHQASFLQRPFRLPLEAILEVNQPSDLVARSLGKTPKFASAPVVGKPVNPFDSSPTDAGTTSAAADASFGSDALGGGSTAPGAPAEIDPFASETDADPFAEDAGDGGDPFAESGDSGSSDPFAGDAGDDDPFDF